MSTEILINVTAGETRIALVEDSVLREIYIERSDKLRLVGNIYKGKVVRVLPGMQAAFVDIGLERTAFLHEADMSQVTEIQSINRVLQEGQEILVQVIKDPVNAKGARLTTQLSIATRALAYVPELEQVNVSVRIHDLAERERLKALLQNGDMHATGFIVRTAAEGMLSLAEDQDYLQKQWQKVEQKAQTAKPGTLVFQDLSLTLRTLRDLLTSNTERMRIDDLAQYEASQKFIADFVPDFKGRLELYTETRPLFDLYSINDEIARALDRKVMLKSGGYLVIDHTEAMTTIDVNTGAYVGNVNLEETVYRTNLEAVAAICRQLRLRNLGGMIIIDFIDMQEPEHKEKVLRAMERELSQDNIKTTVSDFTALGLIEMTRKRTRESLQHSLCEQCITCNGRGFIHSVATVVCDILREIQRSICLYPTGNVLIIAAPMVIEHLFEEESIYIAEIEQKYKKTIKLQAESLYTPEQFDVVLL